jgi:hypothetical protein
MHPPPQNRRYHPGITFCGRAYGHPDATAGYCGRRFVTMADMVDISPTQQKRVNKIARLRQYFQGVDSPEIYEWTPATDEQLDFAQMTDDQIAAYLKRV